MLKTVYALVAGALVLSIGIGVLMKFGATGPLPGAQADDDPRTVLELSSDQNASVRGEMRKLLASVAGIVEGIAENDFDAVSKAARSSGMSMAAQVEVALKKKLPVGFMKLGKGVHVGFDEIADAAATEGADKGKLLLLLSGQLQRCVACHDTYSLK